MPQPHFDIFASYANANWCADFDACVGRTDTTSAARSHNIGHQLLVRALASQALVTLVGSGMSVCLGYPTWNQLADQLSSKLTPQPAAKPPTPPPGTGTPLDPPPSRHYGLQRITDLTRLHPTTARTAVVDLLRAAASNVSDSQRSRLYGPLLQLPLHRFVTTNYDYEIERAISDHRGIDLVAKTHDPFSVARDLRCSFTQDPQHTDEFAHFLLANVRSATDMVFHCHGRLDAPDSMLLTRDDYDRHYYSATNAEGQDAGHLQVSLHALFRSNSVFMLGFGMSELDLQRILRPMGASQFRPQSLGHIFLLLDDYSPDPLDSRSRDVLYHQKAREFWDEFGVIPIRLRVGPPDAPDWMGAYENFLTDLCARYSASLHTWRELPPLRKPRSLPESRALNLWGSKDAWAPGTDDISPNLREQYAKVSQWAHGANHKASVLLVVGPPGSGKLRFARSCYEMVRSMPARTVGPIRAVYVNLHRAQDVVSVVDRIIAFLDPHESAASRWLPRTQRLASALATCSALIVLSGLERLLQPSPSASSQYRPVMPFVQAILDVLAHSSSRSLTILTSRTPYALSGADVVLSAPLGQSATWRTWPNTDEWLGVLGGNEKLLAMVCHAWAQRGAVVATQQHAKTWQALIDCDAAHHWMQLQHPDNLLRFVATARRRPVAWSVFEFVELCVAAEVVATLAPDAVLPRLSLRNILDGCIEVAKRLSQTCLPISDASLRAAIERTVSWGPPSAATRHTLWDPPHDLADIDPHDLQADERWRRVADQCRHAMLRYNLLIAFPATADSTLVSDTTYALDKDYADYVMRRHLRNPNDTVSDVGVSDFASAVGVTAPSSTGEAQVVSQVYSWIMGKADGEWREKGSQDQRRALRDGFHLVRNRLTAVTVAKWASTNDADEVAAGPLDVYSARLVNYLWRTREYILRDLPPSSLWLSCPARVASSEVREQWLSRVFREDAPLFGGDLAWLYSELGFSLVLQGLLREALVVFKLATEVARAVDLDHPAQPYVVGVRLKEAQLYIRLGLLQEAESVLDECARMVSPTDELAVRIIGYRAYLLHLQAQFQSAQALYDACLGRLIDLNLRAYAYFSFHYGHLLLSMQQPQPARRRFEESIGIATRMSLPVIALDAHLGLVRHYRTIGDLETAEHHLREPYGKALQLRLRRLEADARFEKAILLAGAGDRERAKREALECLNVANRFSPGLLQTKALLAVGRAHLPADDAADGRDALGTSSGTQLGWARHRVSSLTDQERLFARVYLQRAKQLAVQQTYWVRARIADELLVRFGLAQGTAAQGAAVRADTK